MDRFARLQQDGWDYVEPILFYHPSDSYGLFSNFSHHSVTLTDPWSGKRLTYATGEHRYQALKATTREEHDWVVVSDSAFESKQRGRLVDLREDWGDKYGSVCWWVMLENIMAKTLQHDDVAEALLSSDNRLIYEDSPTDDIWGWRYRESHTGRNLLGRAFMETRDLLR